MLNFYERRARRILPALYVVMLFTMPVSWALMLPDDIENYSESLAATVFFGNNILLWLTSGYFSLANEFKPLVHTWSLGVEEQYYALFPVVFLALWLVGKRVLIPILIGLALFSLIFSQWSSEYIPIANYFLLPMRGWELLLGGAAAIYLIEYKFTESTATRAISELASLIGLALIFYAVFAFNKNTPFPSVFALVPTVDALLIILFANQTGLVGRILSTNALVGVGSVSYSAYLWHQPLLAFMRISSLEEPSPY